MAKKEKNEGLANIGATVGKFELFVEKNNKIIYGVLIGIIVIIGLIVLYFKFIREPKINEAANNIFKAEYYVSIDSFKLALNGDGVFPGFLDIIDDYGSTPSGNVANYYAGICYLRLGEFENAIDYFKSYKSGDPMSASMAIGNIGNAYMELGNTKEALSYFLKAAKKANNDFLSPFYLLRAGEACELLNDNKQALDIYTKIDKEYFGSQEQRNIEKYIERVKTKIEFQNK
ncbi:MAG: tetratricopeptide repeat protein [Bacteroidales bacterium]|jgi:tetratricopeptide (TPR) repeat protein|nr:tetratricopeptide repeat protein [Bacteroidales bacterium]